MDVELFEKDRKQVKMKVPTLDIFFTFGRVYLISLFV